MPFPVVPLASKACFSRCVFPDTRLRFFRPYGTGFIVCDLPRTCVRGCILSPLCGWGARCGLVRVLVGVRGAGWDSRFLTAAPRRFGMTKFLNSSCFVARLKPGPSRLCRWRVFSMLFASSLLDSFVPTGLVSLFVTYPGLASGAAFFRRFAAGACDVAWCGFWLAFVARDGTAGSSPPLRAGSE